MELSEFNSLIHLLEIEEYSQKKGPITYISDILLEQKFIIDLISREDSFKFNIGRPKLIPKSTELMLTISSILFLHRFNILEDVLNSYNVVVLRSTITYLEDEIHHIRIERNKLLNKEKRERFKTEKEKISDYIDICNSELDRLAENLELLKQTRIIDIYGKYNIYRLNKEIEEDPSELFIDCDLDTAFFAKTHGLNILIDDAITLNAFSYYFNLDRDTISNVAGIINSIVLDNYDKYVGVLESMVDIRYEYVLDEVSLFKLLLNMNSSGNYNSLKSLLAKAIKKDRDKYYFNLFKSVSSSGILDKREKNLTERILEAK